MHGYMLKWLKLEELASSKYCELRCTYDRNGQNEPVLVNANIENEHFLPYLFIVTYLHGQLIYCNIWLYF
jgi:hypothetical protein